MRAVFDTNVIVSGLVSAHGLPAQLLALGLMGAFDLVLSEHILSETERTLAEPYFRQRLTAEDSESNLALLRREAVIVEITAQVQGVAPSPADDLVLATALSANAEYLVTGDRGLQSVGAYQGSVIVSPRDFLTSLGRQQPSSENSYC
jgi:putative PIN family toxin of toxin-antitoxin system